MTLPELLLAIYAAAVGLILAVWRKPGTSMWRLIAIAGVALLGTVVAVGTHRLEAVPIMIVALVVAALAYRRSRWQSAPVPSRRRILGTAVRCIVALIVVSVVALDAAFIEIFDPLTNAPIEDIFFAGP